MKENEYFLYFIIFSFFLFLLNVFVKKSKEKSSLYEKIEEQKPDFFLRPEIEKCIKVAPPPFPVKKEKTTMQEEILSNKNLQRAVILSEILKRPYLD